MSKLQSGNALSGKSKQSGGASKKSKSGLLIVIVVILVFVASGIIVFMLNIGNLRESVLSFLSPQTTTDKEASEQEILEAQIRDEILRLSAMEDDLDSREKQLNIREAEIDSKEDELERMMQENIDIREKLSSEFENILSIVELYSNMETEQAAQILSRMENQEQVILILKNLDKRKAGEILGLMEPDTAAEYTKRMMQQNPE